MRFYRWTQRTDDRAQQLGLYEPWYLNIQLTQLTEWDLMAGQLIDSCPEIVAHHEAGTAQVDFPLTSPDLPVHSLKLKRIIEQDELTKVQYLPLTIMRRGQNNLVEGYSVANYLNVIDGVDRQASVYQVWTEDNLVFWEKRPYLLGTFRDIPKLVLNSARVRDVPLFRLKGWELAVIVREDLKQAMEAATITGCRFVEVHVV
jgi:hypothetical protein